VEDQYSQAPTTISMDMATTTTHSNSSISAKHGAVITNNLADMDSHTITIKEEINHIHKEQENLANHHLLQQPIVEPATPLSPSNELGFAIRSGHPGPPVT
jgi:hypothetical protein